MTAIKAEVAVIGSGVIGLCSALELAEAGYEVMVIANSDAGAEYAASYGNAGTVAPYGVIPVGNPGILRDLPKLLTSPDSPFAMRWTSLPGLAPWLIRFILQSRSKPARRNATALASLLSNAIPSWQQRASDSNVTDMTEHKGCLYIYRNHADLDLQNWENRQRVKLGIKQQSLNGAEVAEMEPVLGNKFGAGLYFPDAIHLADPAAVLQKLSDHACRLGVRFIHDTVLSLDPGRGNSGTLINGQESSYFADYTVIAAGVWSRKFAAMAGDKVPLDTERGYHLEFETNETLLSRPVCPVDKGFYMTPMQGRLRVAGTVELGGIKAGPNPKRFTLLERGVRSIFPHLPSPAKSWLGFRPSLPDSLPVIGPSRHNNRIIYAFGHGHLGLTLGPVTANAVKNLITDHSNSNLLAPFSAKRFD
ncbi:NAD(P)/FAD-dependent oxidoreductase [Thalassospira australica]|uniref:NAD(P)/FAD-dependent oxidoreductase n=1 Tax=Thalassospira australica TaxID=1528106 RepID=UPI0038502346